MRAVSAPKSLLLVDDSNCYCTLMEREFRRAGGMAVWTLSDGQRAIEHLALCGTRHPMPDLVLLDRTMPGGPDGNAVLRAVRALAHLQALPILVVSGSNETEHVAAASDAGASGYIVKPAEQDAYARLVQQVLAWWGSREDEKMLRTFCAALTPDRSLADLASVESSSAMTLTTPALPVAQPEAPLAQMVRHLGDFFSYVTGGNVANTSGLFIDRKLMEITIACREEGIEEKHALGKSQDPVLVEKRGKVILRLMRLQWSNTELLERFGVRDRTIEKLRKQFREGEAQRSCGVVAPVRR